MDNVGLEKNYVLLVYEKGSLGSPEKLGYWDGKIFWSEGQSFPGAIPEKFHMGVKRYKSKKRAEKASDKFKKELPYVDFVEIETILINND